MYSPGGGVMITVWLDVVASTFAIIAGIAAAARWVQVHWRRCERARRVSTSNALRKGGPRE